MDRASPPLFLSYARLDVLRAREVYQWLTRGGIECWMDEVSLRVGQDWKREIDKAIRASQIFVACLSTNSVSHRGFFQTELRTAYEVWKTVPTHHVFLLPVRLDECEIPDEIKDRHFLDFFAPEGPAKLLRDISHYVNPESPALRLREALEHIRTRRLDEALKILEQLKIVVDDRNPELRLRVLYDIACAQSLSAEAAVSKSPERSSMLDTALAGLKEWYEYGLSTAWARTGRTVENEVFRMGSDADLLGLLAERPAQIKELFGSNAKALPDRLPRRSTGGGGGCILLTQPVDTPGGPVRFEDLRVGTRISSYLPNQGNAPLATRIAAMHSSREPECVILNNRWIATPSQTLIDIANQKLYAGAVPVGARLATLDGRGLVVESVGRRRGHFEVGTLTTDHPSHNFVCSGLIFGNKYK